MINLKKSYKKRIIFLKIFCQGFSKTFLLLWFCRKYNLIKSYYNHYIKYRNSDYKVTVLVLTYNQVNTIKKTLDSILEQKVNFKYKIVIGDDASNDGTSKIVREYAKKYSEIIPPLICKKNVGVLNNLQNIRKMIDTEYWILLEGDDYWNDINKLQIQFDIMNENLDCVYTAHPIIIRYLNSNKLDEQWCNYEKGKYLNKPLFTHTTSKFFRNIINFKKNNNKYFLYDTPIVYIALFYGKWYHLNKIMSVYNVHNKGIWSSLSEEEKTIKNTIFFALLYNIFGKKIINKNQIDLALLEKVLNNKKYTKDLNNWYIKKIIWTYNKLSKKLNKKSVKYLVMEDNNRINKKKQRAMNSFYTKEELINIGFKLFGKNVLISKKVSIYDAENIEIGSNVRIDDFCILSGKIKFGNYIHIGAYSFLCAGKFGIEIKDFSVVSGRVSIYAQSDDFSGEYLISPMVSSKYTNVVGNKVILEKHTLVGTGSTILQDVVIREGGAIGAKSLVKKSTEEWSVYAGIPAKKIKNRSKKLLILEKNFLKEKNEKI